MRDDRHSGVEALAAPLAAALERAAGTIARLDAALASHPLAPAWAWRARLDAVRRQAAVDGKAIDPWHLAALIEGVRLRVDHVPPMLERGLLFAAAQPAFALYGGLSSPTGRNRTRSARPGRTSKRAPTGNRRCSAPLSRSMPGSIAAASDRRCAPRWFGIGCAGG
jgi:hypothetical protein